MAGHGVGKLIRWDSYSVILEVAPMVEVLLKQAPGQMYRCMTCDPNAATKEGEGQ